MTDETDATNYGPLQALIGTWEGDKGMDISPEPDGSEENPYYESLTFFAARDVENAESQTLAILRDHQVVRRKSNDEVFHDQSGYWTWDARDGVIAQSVVIPRAVCVLAGGQASGGGSATATSTAISVAAKLGDPDWGIIQSPFMRDNAKTLAFRHELSVADGIFSYAETTSLEIYGRSFEHTDENQLKRTN